MERLYITFPDVPHAQHAVDELLVRRIDIHHIGVIAKEGTNIKDLPEASLSVRSDIRHSLILGVLLGAVIGIGAGLYLHEQLSMALSGYMFVTTFIGALFGAWAASMMGMVSMNSDLEPFSDDIEHGKLLLIVDVPYLRLDEIKTMLNVRHPEAKINTLM